jgi:hypothetical protein
MARRAEPVVEEEAERDYTLYANKPPTGTMEAFADWIIDVCGLEFPNQKAEDQFRDGVRLGGTLRMEFQASDFWRNDERNPRSEAGRKARASSNGAAKEDSGPKPARRGRAAAKEDPEPEEEATAEPAKPAARSGRRSTASTRSSGRRGKPAAAPATGEGTEAPY